MGPERARAAVTAADDERAHVGGRAPDVQRERVGPPELEQVVDHHREPRRLVLDRLQPRGARARALALPQHGGVDADHRERVAQVVADLRDVEAALAIEVAQAVREVLERSGDPADLAAAAHERDVAVTVAEPLRSIHDRLELPAVAPARALEEAHADEHEDEPDRHEALGLDQQQIALDVLRRAARRERAQRAGRASASVPRSPARPGRTAARAADRRPRALRRSTRGACRRPPAPRRAAAPAAPPRACARGRRCSRRATRAWIRATTSRPIAASASAITTATATERRASSGSWRARARAHGRLRGGSRAPTR